MSSLNSEDIAHLSRLARINLTNEEEHRFANQLSSVVNYVDQLSHVDTSAITELWGVTGQRNVYAADEPRPGDDPLRGKREALLAGAPAREGHFIEVRAVMGDEVAGA